MKIVHALYSDRQGGLEQAFVNVTKMLLALGYEVELWTPKGAPYIDKFDIPLKYVDLTSHGYLDLYAMMRHHWYLRRKSPDLIITHNSRATSLLARARKGLCIPHLAFSHSYKTHRIKNVDHMVVLTEDMKHHFVSSGHSNTSISIFPNVIEKIPNLVPRDHLRQDQPIRLGFVGRLNEEKGLKDLLHALALLIDRCQLELHVAGSGPDQLKIEYLAKKLGIASTIYYSGWVDNVGKWLESKDFAVFPSRYEPFGIVVLEATAYGCPVIATDVAGPASQITHGVNGWLAKPASPKDLANVILEAINSPSLWCPIRKEAHNRSKKYLMSANLGQLQSIIDKTLDKPD